MRVAGATAMSMPGAGVVACGLRSRPFIYFHKTMLDLASEQAFNV